MLKDGGAVLDIRSKNEDDKCGRNMLSPGVLFI